MNTHRKASFEATAIDGVSSSIIDGLIECQHQTMDFSGTVLMHADFMFDASVDDIMPVETQAWCNDLIREFPQTELFILTK
jgi:hypothetical protein